AHTLPVKAERASMTCVQRRSAHRTRRTTLVVGTGGAVRPLTLCLSAQGFRSTDPTIAPAFDGLKYFRLSQDLVYRPFLLGSSFLGPRDERFNRRLSPPGFPQCPTVRELRGAIAPSTEMSRIAIYLPESMQNEHSQVAMEHRSTPHRASA